MADTVVRRLRRPVAPKNVPNRRWSANWLAALATSTDQIPCIVEDISAGGAKLRLGLLPESEETGTLVMADHEPIPGFVAWRSGDRIGLMFTEQQPFIEELLAKTAQQAVRSFMRISRKGTLIDL